MSLLINYLKNLMMRYYEPYITSEDRGRGNIFNSLNTASAILILKLHKDIIGKL